MTDDEMLRELLYEANLETLRDPVEKFVRSLGDYKKLNGALTKKQSQALKKVYDEVFQ